MILMKITVKRSTKIVPGAVKAELCLTLRQNVTVQVDTLSFTLDAMLSQL